MRKLEDILAEEQREDPRDLRSRSDARKERLREETRLAELARRLVATSDRLLEELSLPDGVLDAVLDGRRIKSAIAAKRQIRRIRSELRSVDAEQIEARLEARVSPGGAAAVVTRASEHWTGRVLAEGDPALDALVAGFPAADRQRLRHLMRRAAAARPAERARARGALFAAIRALVEAGEQPSEAAS